MNIRRILVRMLSLCIALTAIGSAWAEEEALYPLQGATRVRSVLRGGPGTSYPQVQVFKAGAKVTLLGKAEGWYQVQREQYVGYMREDLIIVSGASGSIPDGGNFLPPPAPPSPTPAPGVDSSLVGGEASSTSAPTSTNTATSIGSQLGARILRQGSKGTDVLELQRLLLQLGYNPNGLDGVFGAGTRNAVARFQAYRGISADGVVGPQTVGQLLAGGSTSATENGSSGNGANIAAPTPTPSPSTSTQGSNNVSYLRPPGSYQMLSKGSSGAAVTALQTALQILGYYAGSITGSYDTTTVNAVKAFQANNSTGVDGIAGSATQTILYERTPRSASEPAPTPKPLPEGAGQIAGPSPSQIELAHWFNDVKLKYRSGQTYTVYDPASGLGWNLKFYAMGNHADSEPLTQLDTDIMFKAFGYINTWSPKPVYAKMPDGRWILASMHNVPHLTGSIKDNGFDGHLCVHFYRDMEEAAKNDPNYGVQNQNVIRTAWSRIAGQ